MPYKVLTPLRKQLLRAFHENPSFTSVAEIAELDREMLQGELLPLIASHLIDRQGDTCRPTFFIADAVETERVVAHASEMGRQLAAYLLQRWSELTNQAQKLKVSKDHAFSSLAFLLVGDRVLDTGLLDALARDAVLMPSAPYRPGPDTPDARYYFWMIEGSDEQTGRYGQNAISLPWEAWQLLTFGQYTLGGQRNDARQKFEQAACNLLDENPGLTPDALAQRLGIPAIDQADAWEWTQQTRSVTNDLVTQYWRNQSTIRQIYSTLQASSYAPYGFGEFFCWYDHIAYASAIDQLAAAGELCIPDQRFVAALWNGTPLGSHF